MTVSASRRRTILVVDDEPEMQALFERILSVEDADLLGAGTGAEALAIARRTRLDLVILDIKLPDVSGTEVLRRLRKRDESLAVIMVTSYGSADTVRTSMRLGAFDYVTKPFNIQGIRRVVRGALASGAPVAAPPPVAACDGLAAVAGGQSGRALYLYCLARAAALPALEGPGIDDAHRLDLIPFKDVVAVVSVASVDDFCGPSSAARMEDLAWVGPRVCRHQGVVEAAMRHSPVVPAPFAVLFSSAERLRTWLETDHDAISRALDRFASHEEWAVKVKLDRRTAEARVLEAATDGHDQRPSASAGAHYLRQRGARVAAGPKLDAWLSQACTAIVGDLLHHAAEFREREVLRGPSEADGSPVANWAFLVPRRGRDAFAGQVESINDDYVAQGLSLGLSGPWPPYSFCPRFEPEPSG
jgi:CheY-like chemotaxis protein